MKKFFKRIALILLAVLIAVQAPFIYRRYKVGKLAEKISELNSQRKEPVDSKFKEYKGIIHAHTNLGGHSTGSFDELIAAANANDLDFVVMTEHWSDSVDTAALTLNGIYGKTLFIGGNEIDTADGDRFLMIPGSADAASLRKMSTPAVLEKLHTENRLALVTYPEKFKSWDSNFDGIEVFSLHTNAKRMNPFTAIFDGIWSFPSYPELVLASYFERPSVNLQRFDEIGSKLGGGRPLFAGTDAHSNIGFHLFGDDAGNKGLNLKIDHYDTIFRLVRQHVLIEKDRPLTKDSLTDALKAGRSYIGLDVLARTDGFTFEAKGEGTSGSGAASMGGGIASGEVNYNPHIELPIYEDIKLEATSPLPGRFVIFRNGDLIHESEITTSLRLQIEKTGAYRVEVYLDQLGPPFDKMPWIISNPIYVR